MPIEFNLKSTADNKFVTNDMFNDTIQDIKDNSNGITQEQLDSAIEKSVEDMVTVAVLQDAITYVKQYADTNDDAVLLEATTHTDELTTEINNSFMLHKDTDITRWNNAYLTERATIIQNLYSMGFKEDTTLTHTITLNYTVTDENGGIVDIVTKNIGDQFITVDINNQLAYSTEGIIEGIGLKKSFLVDEDDVLVITVSDTSMIEVANITPVVYDAANPTAQLIAQVNALKQTTINLQAQVLSVTARMESKELDPSNKVDIETASQGSGYTVVNNNGLGAQITGSGLNALLGNTGLVTLLSNGVTTVIFDNRGALSLELGLEPMQPYDVKDGDIITSSGMDNIFCQYYMPRG